MRIKGKLCGRLETTRKLQLSNPVPVYYKTLADEQIFKKIASENYLGDVVLSPGIDGLCFEMPINDQKEAGLNLKKSGVVGCRSFFNASGRKITGDDLSQALVDNSISAIIPLAVVLDTDGIDAGSSVEDIY